MSQAYPQYPYAAPSFRRRRPVLFVFLLLVGLLLVGNILFAAWGILNEAGVFSGPRLGVVKVEGFIGDADPAVDWIEKLRKDSSVAGVLVRIDSPGGAVAPSQEVYMAVKRLAKGKPVVVSMGSVAASGGYYIAVAGREIFASPSTLTGSIGVRLQVTNVQNLMERLGVTSESLTTGKFKASGSPFKELTDEERAYLQGLLDDMQAQFVDAVAEGRNLPKEAVAALADGRVLTGRQALKAGLVDRLGDRQAALAHLAALCKTGDSPALLEGPEKRVSWWRKLLGAALELGAEQAPETVKYQFVY